MGQTKPKHQAVFGQFTLGADRLQQPLPPGLTLNPGYTRTPTRQGQVIGNRSDAHFYHRFGPQLPYYGADQVFTATEWDNEDGSGFRSMPIRRVAPFNGTIMVAHVHYDQPAVIGVFTRAVVHIAGVSYDDPADGWNVALCATNAESNPFFPAGRGFSFTFDADAQTVANLNLGAYPSIPGAIDGLKTPPSSIDYIAFALYF